MESNKKSNVIMLHGWTNGDIAAIPEFLPTSDANWMGWTRNALEKAGYTVDAPFIRYGYKSEYEDWKLEIEKLHIDENTILVGWSSGGAFWVRWLSENNQRVKKLILVAPAKVVGNTEESVAEIHALEINPEWRPQWERFHDFECSRDIKDRVEDIVIFISNDAHWLTDAARLYSEEFEAELIQIENQGHFENHRRPSPAFPEMLEVITR